MNIALFKMERQTELDFTPRTWGGARAGAGRKTSDTRNDPAHRARPDHVGRFPLHVVMRTRPEVPRLRRLEVHDAMRGALTRIAERTDFRIVHISLQHNHVHLIVEADDKAALESGMRAFAISLARRINRALDRKGKVFAFRYHATALRSPTQTRNAIAYVLNNWRRHNEDERGERQRTAILDPYSSAITFPHWADWSLTDWPANFVAFPVASPQTWMLAKGWLLAKRPIRTHEVPGKLRG